MVKLCSTDDRRGDDRLGEQPRQRNLRPWDAPRYGDLGYAVDDLSVCLLGFGEEPLVSVVSLGANARVVPVPRQPTASLRAPGDDADSFRRAQRQRFSLFLAVEEVHQVLHADETGPAVAFGNAESARELPRMH